MGSPNIVDTAYAEIFNSSGESILVVDTNGKVLLANPKSERLFGFNSNELMGQAIEILIPKRFKEAHDGHRDNYNRNPTSKQMGVGRDLIATTKDGAEFPIEVSLSPAMVMGERVVIAFVIDITERKRIELDLEKSEKRLMKYAAELEIRVNERTVELESAINKLEESNQQLEKEVAERRKLEEETNRSLQREKELNELKSRFVSMASHEFRTPLSTILSSAGLIARYSEKGEKEKEVKHIERIKSNVHDLTGILNDFLSLDKLESGKIQNNPQLINAVGFVREITDELQSLTKNDQQIIFSCTQDNCDLFVDPQMLKHIMMNLLSNAIKYSGENTIINTRLYLEKEMLAIEVEDQGIGIPESDQKHLFERFFRAHNATHIQGTGLGLNLVKKYLDIFGGNIHYRSEQQKGSIFTVHIPKPTHP